MTLAAAVARCATHTEETATATCVRCGGFTCARCPTNPFFPGVCEGCLERVTAKASTRSILAVVFGGLSVGIYCFPLGIAAVILANQELAAIARGESPETGKSYAQAARIIGWIGTGLTLVGVVVGVLMALAR